jgi:aerobic-type carbon monoxide dehydrogenase small subunit (CoxS/CutS family)
MDKFKLIVNNIEHEVSADAEMPLLWVLRDRLNLTGTKYGCGIAQCGACMVLIDGIAIPSCVTSIASANNKQITTIEGLPSNNSHPVQRAWIELQVPQCGYCHSGQILSAAALLEKNNNPSDSDIDTAMSPILCRCGTYQRIRLAIHRAAELMNEKA